MRKKYGEKKSPVLFHILLELRSSLPVQQPLLSRDLLDLRDVLGDLKAAAILACRIPYREVADVDHLPAHLDPELSHVLGPRLERRKYLLHHVHALGGMTVLHSSADDAGAPREQAVRSC